jgi:hypothetical protein
MLDKTAANHFKTFEYTYTMLFHGRENSSSHFPFHTMPMAFFPWKISSERE